MGRGATAATVVIFLPMEAEAAMVKETVTNCIPSCSLQLAFGKCAEEQRIWCFKETRLPDLSLTNSSDTETVPEQPEEFTNRSPGDGQSNARKALENGSILINY